MTPKQVECRACCCTGEFDPEWSIFTVGPKVFAHNPHKEPATLYLCAPCATILISWIKVERYDVKERG